MLDIKTIIALPDKQQWMVDKIHSYPFYVLYGLGYDCEYRFDNYVSHFGMPRYIIDRAKGGQSYHGVPVLSSLGEVPEVETCCVIISAPSFASEIAKICRKYLDKDALILYAGEHGSTGKDYPQFLGAHKDEILSFCEDLADDKSRFIFERWLMGRVSKDPHFFFEICSPNNYINGEYLDEECQRYAGYDRILPVVTDRSTPSDSYFTTDLFELDVGSVFYDIGTAYGDTVAGFFQFGSSSGKVVAAELDPKVAERLRQFCNKHNYDVDIVNCGVADEEGVLQLESGNLGGSSIDLCPDQTAARGAKSVVRITTIDTLVRETQKPPTFIKMDIEGAELSALHGAAETIRSYKPKLAICIYHKPQDIVEIPQYIHLLRPDYRFYVRHFSVTEAELVLFAV